MTKISQARFDREAVSLLRGYGPTIIECKECGHPCLHGYCCTFCGNSNPTESKGRASHPEKQP